MRLINEVIIHCSATREGQNVQPRTIKKWHTDPKPKGEGWADIGYHYIITLDGKIYPGRSINIPGAHVRGHNKHSIGICYVGGVDKDRIAKDTRTPEQKASLAALVPALRIVLPTITKVSGHNEYASKACPSFNVKEEFQ